MEEMFTGIANLGFPIVISIYLLVRIEGKLNELTASIIELSKTIASGQWSNKIDGISIYFVFCHNILRNHLLYLSSQENIWMKSLDSVIIKLLKGG